MTEVFEGNPSRGFGDRHGGRSYRDIVGPASLPAKLQTG